MLIFCFPFDLILLILLSLSFPKPAVAKSLAIPLTPKQSGLFGVIAKSIKFELFLLNRRLLVLENLIHLDQYLYRQHQK